MRKNIQNQKFGSLTVISYAGSFPVGKQCKTRGKWLCQCTCGKTCEKFTGDLTSGNDKSCGCRGLWKNGRKKCSLCNFFKDPTQYEKSSLASCKTCLKERRKKNYDPKKRAEYYSKITEEQKEARRVYARNKRNEDPEKANQRVKDWRKRNPNYRKNRLKNDLNYRITDNLRGRVYKAVKGHVKSDTTKNLLGCPIKEFREYLETMFVGNMSWENYGEWHIDHIKPCALFDMTKEEQQRECFHYTNLQPLWAVDNLTKGKNYEESNINTDSSVGE